MPSASEAFPAQPGLWVIEPRQHGAFARLRELWAYRYLWWYFASATVTALYRRSALGWLWLLMRVVAPIGLNAIVFGDMLDQAQKVGGRWPYFLFFLCGIATWMLFERSLFFMPPYGACASFCTVEPFTCTDPQSICNATCSARCVSRPNTPAERP